MRIAINDLLELLAAEAMEHDAQPEQPDYSTDEEGETLTFDNNADAIRQLFEESMIGEDYSTAYNTVLLANELQINLIEKA